MHVTGRVHDLEHGVVGVATFVGLYSPNESTWGIQAKYPNGGNALYDLDRLLGNN